MKRLLYILLALLIVMIIYIAGGKLVPIIHDLIFECTTHSHAELTVKAYADANDLSYHEYPKSLIELLERNPETQQFVLEYPFMKTTVEGLSYEECQDLEAVPLLMQWDQRWGYIPYGNDVAGLTGCGPVCLSMAAVYLTGDPLMSPDRILRFSIDNGYCVPGNGTSWTLISEGGKALGLDVTEIPLVESIVYDNLEAGNPIICVMGPGDFTTSGHYIVMVGLDNGQIQINDPNSFANSEKLWNYYDICDQILNLWVIRNGN